MLCVGRSVQLKCHWITKIHHSHRGVIVVSIISAGGEKLYCLYFGSGQFMRPEAYSWIFVRVQLGLQSNRSLYHKFSVIPSLLYQAVGMQAHDDKQQRILSISHFNLKGVLATFCLRSHALVQKGQIYWKCLVQALVACSTELYSYTYPRICLGSDELTKTEV